MGSIASDAASDAKHATAIVGPAAKNVWEHAIKLVLGHPKVAAILGASSALFMAFNAYRNKVHTINCDAPVLIND